MRWGRGEGVRWLNVRGESCGDGREYVVDGRGERAHSGDRAESDHCHHKSILNKILSFFASCKVAKDRTNRE